jgi:hypothetical protein
MRGNSFSRQDSNSGSFGSSEVSTETLWVCVLCVFFLPPTDRRESKTRGACIYAQILSDGVLAMCAQDDDFSKRSVVNHSATDELQL